MNFSDINDQHDIDAIMYGYDDNKVMRFMYIYIYFHVNLIIVLFIMIIIIIM